MDPYIIRQRVDMARPGNLQHWPDMMMIEDDANAHCWVVSVYRDGEPVDLTGCKAIGWFTRKDDVVVPINGEIDGNVISVTLDEACYAVHGDLYALLRVTINEKIITLARVRYYVSRGVSDNIYDATGVFPTVAQLLALMETLKAYDDVKLDANHGSTNAGKLLYVSADGSVQPLVLGAGLRIVEGVLKITGEITPDDTEPDDIQLTVDEYGYASLAGAALTVDSNGAALMDAMLTIDADGQAVIT